MTPTFLKICCWHQIDKSTSQVFLETVKTWQEGDRKTKSFNRCNTERKQVSMNSSIKRTWTSRHTAVTFVWKEHGCGTQIQLHHPAHNITVGWNTSASGEELRQEGAAERKSERVYSVVMSFRARSSSSLRALPFSFWAYTSSEGQRHRQGARQTDTQRGNRKKRETVHFQTVRDRLTSAAYYRASITPVTAAASDVGS